MAYTSDKKPGALVAATVLNDGDNLVVEQAGDVKKATLAQVEAKVFASKTQTTTPSGAEVVVVRQTDGSLRQVPLANIVPALNITNAQISESAAIADSKLATINTAGKVTNQAVQATPAITGSSYSNSLGANKIVSRDASGNFAAGTISATLSGNASTATFASSVADASISTAKIVDGAVTSAKIADGTITNNDINAAAAIVDTKLATISTSGKVSNSATTATNANTANAIVSRDGNGDFVAGTITASLAGNVTGNLTGNVTGNVSGSSGSCTGNSSTSTAWQTPRTLTLTGDVAATFSGVDGSANISAGATIANLAVSSAKLADSSVSTAKIANAAVTAEKLSGGQTGSAPVYGCRAWANIDGETSADLAGDYTRIQSLGRISIQTAVAHNLQVGHVVQLQFNTPSSGRPANGTFTVTGLGPSGTAATVFFVDGSGPDISGTVTILRRAIRASGNVANVTFKTNGQYAVNFATPMPSADYAVTLTGQARDIASTGALVTSVQRTIPQTDVSVAVSLFDVSSTTPTAMNVRTLNIAVFG